MLKSRYNQKSAIDLTKRFALILIIIAILFATLPLDILAAKSNDTPIVNANAGMNMAKKHNAFWYKTHVLPAKREASAANFNAAYLTTQAGQVSPVMDNNSTVPHYFGPYPNYAYTPLPKGPVTNITLDNGGNGYKAPIVTIQDVYGTGNGATANATLDPATGTITDIKLTDGGKNYTAPVVMITNSADSAGYRGHGHGDDRRYHGFAQRRYPEVRRSAARPGSCERQPEWTVHPGCHPGHENIPRAAITT